MKDEGCRDSSSPEEGCRDGWRVPGEAVTRVSSGGGVVSPEAKELQVAMSPPGGICPRTRQSQGCGVPALLSHRDLPALAPSPPAPRREGGGPSCLRPSPDLAR